MNPRQTESRARLFCTKNTEFLYQVFLLCRFKGFKMHSSAPKSQNILTFRCSPLIFKTAPSREEIWDLEALKQNQGLYLKGAMWISLVNRSAFSKHLKPKKRCWMHFPPSYTFAVYTHFQTGLFPSILTPAAVFVSLYVKWWMCPCSCGRDTNKKCRRLFQSGEISLWMNK